MIRCMLYGEDHELKGELRASEIERVLANESSMLWLDIEQPQASDLELLARKFGFHPLALEDVGKEQRPKVDQYANFAFIVFYDIDYNAETYQIDEHQLSIFLGKHYLVTLHHEPIEEIEEVAERWQKNAELIDRGIGVLLYSLLDTIVDHYFPVVDEIGERIETLETVIFTGSSRQSLQEIFALKRELLTLRHRITPERDVMALLARRDLPVVGEAVAVYYQDIYDHVLRVTEMIDTFRDLLSSVLDSYLSMNANNMAVTSNNLSQVMKVLTSYSIILMSMTLIAGVYGMNFDNMPELHTRYGYFVALICMAALGLALAAYFKRKTWL